MRDLAEFLEARIAAVESLAEDCQRLGADVGHLSSWVEIGSDEVDAAEALAGHFSPARVLAECEAKRRIVDWCRHVEVDPAHRVADGVLRLLALPDADHPDYLPEWRPTPVNDEKRPLAG